MKHCKFLSSLVAAALLAGLASCHAPRGSYDWSSGGDDSIYAPVKKKRKKDKKGHTVRGDRGDKMPRVNATGTARDVIDAASSWLGAPYRYGGNSPQGTDCSGLTCMAYERGAGIKLPRSSREQADYSRRIRRGDLRPADLIFFSRTKGGNDINHVAIYLGDNRILHATTSGGVTVSDLDEPYWNTHLHSCGRVL